MAAANLQSRGLVSLGNRFITQICYRDSLIIYSLSRRRGVHGSAYDKNPEDQVQSTVVPDHVIINPSRPEQYWAPDPKTGVFGPSTDQNPASGGYRGAHASASEESVLEQKTFFRPLEDLDKPVQP